MKQKCVTFKIFDDLGVSPILKTEERVSDEGGGIGDVANSKRPLLIIPKVQLRLRVTRRSANALARYPQKLAKIV